MISTPSAMPEPKTSHDLYVILQQRRQVLVQLVEQRRVDIAIAERNLQAARMNADASFGSLQELEGILEILKSIVQPASAVAASG